MTKEEQRRTTTNHTYAHTPDSTYVEWWWVAALDDSCAKPSGQAHSAWLLYFTLLSRFTCLLDCLLACLLACLIGAELSLLPVVMLLLGCSGWARPASFDSAMALAWSTYIRYNLGNAHIQGSHGCFPALRFQRFQRFSAWIPTPTQYQHPSHKQDMNQKNKIKNDNNNNNRIP